MEIKNKDCKKTKEEEKILFYVYQKKIVERQMWIKKSEMQT